MAALFAGHIVAGYSRWISRDATLMDLQITFTREAFRTLLRRLANDSSMVAFCPAGIARRNGVIEFLVYSVLWHYRPCLGLVLIRGTETPGSRELVERSPSIPDVVIEIRAADGQISLHTAQAMTNVTLRVVDSGLPIILFSQPNAGGGQNLLPTMGDKWSRTIGALGLESWSRLRSMRFAIVGCGRTGSLVATSLVRLGVEQLTIIDPDRLELHNVAEMDSVTVHDIGKFKVEAIKAGLARIYGSGTSVTALAISVFDVESLALLREADFLICCVDSPRARRALNFISALFLRPILDIGTAVINSGTGDGLRIGADVRLVSPGRCLHCFGGIRDFHQTMPRNTPGNGPQDRAGSLRSLNQMATGIGVRLVEEYVAGRPNANVWVQINFTSIGTPQVHCPEPETKVQCEFCKVLGRGDDSLHLFGGVASHPAFGTLGRSNA